MNVKQVKSTPKEVVEYMKQLTKIRRHIVTRFKDNGGTENDINRAFNSGGETASRKLIIETIELEGIMLFDQLDSIKKPINY